MQKLIFLKLVITHTYKVLSSSAITAIVSFTTSLKVGSDIKYHINIHCTSCILNRTLLYPPFNPKMLLG